MGENTWDRIARCMRKVLSEKSEMRNAFYDDEPFFYDGPKYPVEYARAEKQYREYIHCLLDWEEWMIMSSFELADAIASVLNSEGKRSDRFFRCIEKRDGLDYLLLSNKKGKEIVVDVAPKINKSSRRNLHSDKKIVNDKVYTIQSLISFAVQDAQTLGEQFKRIIAEFYWMQVKPEIIHLVATILHIDLKELLRIGSLGYSLVSDGSTIVPEGWIAYDRGYRLYFDCDFLKNSELPFDAFYIEFGDQVFKLLFYKNGECIFKNMPADCSLSDLGIDEGELMEEATHCIKKWNSTEDITIAEHFVSKVYPDQIGSFRLYYSVKK